VVQYSQDITKASAPVTNKGNVVVDPIWIQMSPSCSPENIPGLSYEGWRREHCSMIWIGERALLRRIHIKHMLKPDYGHHPISIDLTSINCSRPQAQANPGKYRTKTKPSNAQARRNNAGKVNPPDTGTPSCTSSYSWMMK